MRGSIRQQGQDSWQITVDKGKDENGKRQRHFETLRGRKSVAQKRLNELLVNLEKGIPVPVGRLTVAEYLRSWYEGYVKANCSLRTQGDYRSIIENHLIPAFGQLHLKQLGWQVIQKYYSKACERLSARTVYKQHRVLFESLKYGVRQGFLGRNPCDFVDPPSPRKKAMRTLTPNELQMLLDVAQDSYYYPIIYTAVNTGLRQAELLGLRWRDISLEMMSISVSQVLYKRGGITIFKEPKTTHSRRRVSMTPKLAEFLKEYKANREQYYLETGRVLSPDDLVFPSYRGEPLHPSVVTHSFRKLVARAGLSGIRFHDLRHTFASLMLLRGAKPKVISEALGHASVAFTMDTYSHIISGMQEDAMALLDEVMPKGIVKNNSVADLSRIS